MKLERIYIKNFRSIGEDGVEIIFNSNHTIFVGENNVGKSSIIKAIKKALNFDYRWEDEDWYLGDRNRTIEINIDFVLDEDQINKLISILLTEVSSRFRGFPSSAKEFIERYTNKLYYEFKIKNSQDNISRIFRFKNFIIEKERIIFSPFLNDAEIRISISSLTSEKILDIIREKMIFIDEVREEPEEILTRVQFSSTGRYLPSVLFNFKNSRKREKFDEIRDKFKRLFPNLEIDVITENDKIKILIKKDNVESTTFFIGSGILESLQILTHLVAHEDKIICIDHPELHLHPHVQKALSKLISEKKDTQVLIVTHSPYFINLNEDTTVVRVFQDNYQTRIIQIPKDYFQKNELEILSLHLDIDSKELFFARKVVLVEGKTEVGALPIFSSVLNYDFDDNGVSVISVDGEKNFKLFAKLCVGLKLPCLIICDKDAENDVKKICENYPSIRCHILNKEFENIFPKEVYEKAKKVYGKSKPRTGKYAAKMMVESGDIPPEIIDIINEIRNL